MPLFVRALLLLSLAAPAHAGTSLVEWDLDDPLATDCPVCDDTYHCVDGPYSGLWSDLLGFEDPVPAGQTVTGVDVVLQGVFGCEAPSSAGLSLGGTLVESRSLPGACGCETCEDHTFTAAAEAGWPGYVYGGANTLAFAPTGNFCVASIELTLTWGDGVPLGDDDDSAGPPPGDDDDSADDDDALDDDDAVLDDDDAVLDDDDDAVLDDDDAAEDDDDAEDDREAVPNVAGTSSRGFCSAAGGGGAVLALLPLLVRRQRTS